MPRLTSFLALCWAIQPLVSAAADAPEKGELEGRWKVVSMTSSGKVAADLAAVPGSLGTLYIIVAKDKMYTASSNPMVFGGSQDFVLKTDVVPRQVDWAPAKDAKDKSFGIYRLEKDKLTICVGQSAETRPKEFKLAREESQMLLELVRETIVVDPDFDKLAGTWKVTRRQGTAIEGLPNNRQLEVVKTMEFEPLPYQNEGRVIWKNAKGDSLGSFVWKLDSSRSPKEISLTGNFRSGKDDSSFLLDGVYDSADESLSLTMGLQGSRPESVKPKQPLKMARIGLTRMAKEEK
jgi:uncharacterized protein (TIGR03067 family)